MTRESTPGETGTETKPKRSKLLVLALVLVAAAVAAYVYFNRKPPPQTGDWIHNYDMVDDAYGYVVELEQNWTDDTQEAFYNTPQGSEIMPYSWLLALEQAEVAKPFLDTDNIKRYRYLPRKPSPGNPDGLPVGWMKGKGPGGKEWFGMNCSACHTTQLEYVEPESKKLVAMRIDGAPTLAEFNLMNIELVEALNSTHNDTAKFDKFATKVLPEGATDNEKASLRGELQSQATALDTRNKINESSVHYGFGRIDAIGFILNQVMSTLPGMPQNAKTSDAPVSYPFLWGTDQSDVVQWTGFAPNASGAGTMIRNGGEVFGVYGKIDLSADAHTYPSSINIENLGALENWVRELNSPQWPDELFPKIDTAKAEKGKVLYQEKCASCHQVIPRDKAIETAYQAVITPIDELGTDPKEIQNIARTYEAGVYEGKKTAVIAGEVIPKTTTGLNPLINAVAGSLLHQPGKTIKAVLDEYATHTSGTAPKAPGYKGRPLNGIWATAPYLHNGSVPNLYELLLPAAERSKMFVLGSRLYDPVRVGFAMDQPKTATDYTPFTFDVSPEGNSNAGHEFSTGEGELTDEQRWQLVEYMKTL